MYMCIGDETGDRCTRRALVLNNVIGASIYWGFVGFRDLCPVVLPAENPLLADELAPRIADRVGSVASGVIDPSLHDDVIHKAFSDVGQIPDGERVVTVS